MGELLSRLFEEIVSAAFVLGLFGWVTRKWINNTLERSNLRLRADRSADSERRISEFHSVLRIEEFRLSRLHERRVQVIDELYAKLIEAFARAKSYLAIMEYKGEPSTKEKRDQLGIQMEAFLEFYAKHKIYLSFELDFGHLGMEPL
jgi:hypothetical protein